MNPNRLADMASPEFYSSLILVLYNQVKLMSLLKIKTAHNLWNFCKQGCLSLKKKSREGHRYGGIDKYVPIIDWTPRLSNLIIFWTISVVHFYLFQNLEKCRPYFDERSNCKKSRKYRNIMFYRVFQVSCNIHITYI